MRISPETNSSPSWPGPESSCLEPAPPSLQGEAGTRGLWRIRGQFARESWQGAAPPCSGPLHLPRVRPPLQRPVALYPPQHCVCQTPSLMRLRGWGPQCAGPALSQPTQRLHLPSPVALSSVWPCQGPLLWALSSPIMAPQRKSPAVLPTAPPAPQQASPLSGSPLGIPITPDPAAPQRVLLS